jgi:iron uptake system component EfeO
MQRSLPLLVVIAVASAGCTSNTRAGSSQSLKVTASATTCEVGRSTAPSGALSFNVTNTDTRVNEFYLLANDGLRILGEVENIGPGITRNLVVQAAPGEYFTVCKPGMVGDGLRSKFTVTDSGKVSVTGQNAELQAAATDQYRLYVRDQTSQLSEKTKKFSELYAAGKDAEARLLYPAARLHWERIEPVAESFSDLDPRLDNREADLQAEETWTGWHRIEKDLWPPTSGYVALTPSERQTLATQLAADTQELIGRVQGITYVATGLANGAKELLDEVAASKVTGEEEAWSHTDLWDFQGNVDGARVAFETLKPALDVKNPAMSKKLTERFAALQTLLDQHKKGDGFVLYNDLSAADIRQLADAVSALSEPLSDLGAALVL